jgi:hypothetical protein
LSEKCRLQRFADVVAEQHDLVRSGAGLELLKEAFKILGAQGKPVAIASRRFDSSHPPLGWSTIARDFHGHQIVSIIGMLGVSSTIKILLEAAQAGACTVTKLEVVFGRFDSSAPEYFDLADLDVSLLLGLQEFSFQFERQNRYQHQNSFAHRRLLSLLRMMPTDLKTLAVYSDAVATKTDDVETYSYFLVEGIRSEAFRTIQPGGLESFQLKKLFVYQNNLLQFLDALRGSLKKLVLDEVYLDGDWDHVLPHIARMFSLEQFSLSKAQKVVEHVRNPSRMFMAKTVSWYSRGCELRGKRNMRQNLNKFIELEKTEREVKRAEEQARIHSQERQSGNPPEDQKEEAAVAESDS